MKRYLAGLTAVLALAAASATGTDGPIELPRKDGERYAARVAKTSTCAEVHELLRRRLFLVEKEIDVQSYQRNTWQAFSDAAQVAQNRIEAVCQERPDLADADHPVEKFAHPDSTASTVSDALQLFDRAAKALVDILTPAQVQKFSEALWSFVRSGLEWERSEIKLCPEQQSTVAMCDSAVTVPHANG